MVFKPEDSPKTDRTEVKDIFCYVACTNRSNDDDYISLHLILCEKWQAAAVSLQ